MSTTPREKFEFRALEMRSLDWLLLAIPVAFALRLVPAWKNDPMLFFTSSLAIIPLAGWMSRATENIGERTGPGIGGFLNATFSNAPEFIIAIMALSKGLIEVVKASLIGSILGNILLVLGLSMLAGGLRFPHQLFNQTGIRVAATSLTLATIGLIIPTVFHLTIEQGTGTSLPGPQKDLSFFIAVVLMGTYALWLFFSLGTHRSLFNAPSGEIPPHANEPSPSTWPLSQAILVLALSTLLVAALSEFLSGSVESACKSLGLTEAFVGVFIVAIIGNAGESTAILVALKNKMDLTLSIVIGSSLQIALFVTPSLVFISHGMGTPMTLEFTLPEIASLALAVGVVVLISGDGECNWIEGAQLLSVYLILALFFFFLPPLTDKGSHVTTRNTLLRQD